MKEETHKVRMSHDELPEGWSQSKIGNLCSLKNGRAFKPTEWTTSGLPIVRIQNLNSPKSSYNYFSGEPEPRYHLLGGELLFAWSGTPGTSFGAHVWRGGEAVLNQHIFRVDFDTENMDKRFFRYAINQKLDELIDVAHGGVGLRHVTKGTFESTEIKVPPFREQKRIADKLEAVLGRVDACQTRLDRVPALLKRFRQSVLAAAKSGRLTEDWRSKNGVNDEWEEAQIQHVANVGTGSTPLRSNSAFFAPKGTPWVTSAATSKKLVTESEEFVTDAAIKAHRLKKYPVGTLLVAMYGEGKTRGQVTELGIEATVNQACAAIVVNESVITKRFVKFSLEANYLEMRELAEGGNQPNLNISKIREFPIGLPTLPEQQEIVRRVEALFALADRIEARLVAAQKTVERLTPATLAKAFRGELVPQDPDDEPAAALLARIEGQATTSPKPARKRRTVAKSS